MTKTLEWARIHNGFFLNYYFSEIPHFSHAWQVRRGSGHEENHHPGDGNTPLAFMHTLDAAKFVGASLSLSHWPTRLFIAVDELTWNQFVDCGRDIRLFLRCLQKLLGCFL